MIALPDHWCISSCHLCISSITCEFKCIRSLYAARISCCLIKWCDGQRCSCADITAPLSEFSLPSRLQNLRAVRVSHSFSQKIARISRRVEQILSEAHETAFLCCLLVCPETRTIRRGSLGPSPGGCRSRGCVVYRPIVESGPAEQNHIVDIDGYLEGHTIRDNGLPVPSP